MKRLMILFLIVLLTIPGVLMAGGEETEDTGKLRFGFSVIGSNNPFFVGLNKGMRDFAQDNNIDLQIISAEFDMAKQMADIEDFIMKGMDVIIVEAIDSKAIKPGVDKIVSAGIPVVAVDVTAEGEVAAEILSNNVEIGNLAGEYAVQNLPNGGNVVIIAGGPTSSSIDRVAGFKEVIAKYPNIKIVAEQASFNWATDEAMVITENALQANDRIDYVFCANDTMALGAHAAVVAANRKDAKVIGVNGAEEREIRNRGE